MNPDLLHLHPAAWPDEALLGHCRERRYRASGPGGQRRNKVETALEIVHQPSGLTGQASERRSLAENRQHAVFRLRVNLALGLRLPPAAGQEPSSLWLSRVRGGKIQVNPAHHDFPALLAQALDAWQAASGDLATAAVFLQVTATQLVRFLAVEPRALELVNVQRKRAGQAPRRP